MKTARPTAPSGARFATIVVAADSTSDDGKEGADFVCTGTNDYLTFQDAADRLVDVTATPKRAGKILLLEGDYTSGAGPAVIHPGSSRGIVVEGMGPGTTIFASGAAPFQVDGARGAIRNLTLHNTAGNGIEFIAPPSLGFTIDHVDFECSGLGINWVDDGNPNTGYYLKILHNLLNCGIDLTMVANNLFKLMVEGNIWDTGSGVDLNLPGNGSNHLVVANNHFDSDVTIDGWNYLGFNGNVANDAASDLSISNIFDYAAAGNVGWKTYTESGITNKATAANVPVF